MRADRADQEVGGSECPRGGCPASPGPEEPGCGLQSQACGRRPRHPALVGQGVDRSPRQAGGPFLREGGGQITQLPAGPGDAGVPGYCLAPCQGCPHSPKWHCCPHTPLATIPRVRGQARIATQRWLTPKPCAEPGTADALSGRRAQAGRCPQAWCCAGIQQAPVDAMGVGPLGGQVSGTPLRGGLLIPLQPLPALPSLCGAPGGNWAGTLYTPHL